MNINKEGRELGGLQCRSRGTQLKLLERHCTDPSFGREDRTQFGGSHSLHRTKGYKAQVGKWRAWTHRTSSVVDQTMQEKAAMAHTLGRWLEVDSC